MVLAVLGAGYGGSWLDAPSPTLLSWANFVGLILTPANTARFEFGLPLNFFDCS